jgi:hypothetical protein
MLTFSRVIFLFFSDGELLYISQPPVSVGHHLGRRRNMMEEEGKIVGDEENPERCV